MNSSDVCSSHGECIDLNECRCEANQFGTICNITKCFGKLSNETNTCSGNGECISFNECKCKTKTGWTGESCSIPICYGKLSNDSTVCSSSKQGTCISPDNCQCQTGYTGLECEEYSCFGVAMNSSNVCSSKGDCLEPNSCQCNSNYFGSNCEINKCFGELSNSSFVCSSHGNCIDYDICECESNYFGPSCNITSCYGILSNATSIVCHNTGSCTAFDKCSCTEGWFGEDCSVTSCYGTSSNSSLVCSKHGRCFSPNKCDCKIGYSGDLCNNYSCFNVHKNSTNVCSLHGVCIDTDICECEPNYFGKNCNITSCFGKLSNDSSVCSGNGKCISFSGCICNSGWTGEKCSVPLCFGIAANSSKVCSYSGQCTDFNDCECNQNYLGDNCEITQCFGTFSNDTTVCNSNGKCSDFNYCQCNSGWDGANCSIPICHGIPSNSALTCNSRGKCIAPNSCQCNNGYFGNSCELFECYFTLKNDSNVCSSHGKCVAFDSCECEAEYQGNDCSVTSCNNILSNNSIVCSSRGSCLKFNNCSCFEPNKYSGSSCNITKCFGELSNSTSVCSSNGKCTDFNECECKTGWRGATCSIPICFGKLSNDSTVCSSSKQGECISPDNCQCETGYSGLQCEEYSCFGVAMNSSNVCSSKGDCLAPNSCQCNSNYFGSNCEINKCFEELSNSSSVCSSHGSCISSNKCTCYDHYFGERCDIFKCYSYLNNETQTCSGNGKCINFNTCNCTKGYMGNECQFTTCFGINSNSSNVCSSRGTCKKIDSCECENNYFGNDCSLTTCFGVVNNDRNVCSGKGNCTNFNTCTCIEGWGGVNCSKPSCFGFISDDPRVCDSGMSGTCVLPNICQLRGENFKYKIEPVVEFSSQLARTGTINSIAIDETNGNIYFADGSKVFLWNSTGISLVAGTAASNPTLFAHSQGYNGENLPALETTFATINDIVLSKDGDLIVNDIFRIRKIDKASLTKVISGIKSNTNAYRSGYESLQRYNKSDIYMTEGNKIFTMSNDGIITAIQWNDQSSYYIRSICISSNAIYFWDAFTKTLRRLNNTDLISHPIWTPTSDDGIRCTTLENDVIVSNNDNLIRVFENGTVETLFNSNNKPITSLVSTSEGKVYFSFGNKIAQLIGSTVLIVFNGDNYFESEILVDGITKYDSKMVYACSKSAFQFLSDGKSVLSSFSSNSHISFFEKNNIWFASGYRINNVSLSNDLSKTIEISDYVDHVAGSKSGHIYYAKERSIFKLVNGNPSQIVELYKETSQGSINCLFVLPITLRNGTIVDEIYFGYTAIVSKINIYGQFERIIGVDWYEFMTSYLNDPLFGYYGDGGPAILGRISFVKSIFVTSQREIYIAETPLGRIRKISQNGIISTIAGNGDEGFNYQNLTATLAQLNMPDKLFVDEEENTIYFSENGGRVRRLVRDGCLDGYIGDECKYSCFGIAYDDSQVCNGRGLCQGLNNCTCFEPNKYSGLSCNITKCFGKLSNSPSVCSSNGKCTAFDECECKQNYFGDNCEITQCFGILSNDTTVCNSNGKCTNFDNCQCNSGWDGANCSIPICHGIPSNSALTCNSRGKCIAPNSCQCNNGYFGNSCELFECYFTLKNDSNVCSSHGKCVAFDSCECEAEYQGNDCSITSCNKIFSNNSIVCSSRGSCLKFNNCSCFEPTKYSGSSCNITKCFGELSNSPSVCSSHGKCTDFNECTCKQHYFGVNCEITQCFNKFSNDTSVCSSHGECIGFNQCRCEANYIGSNCEITQCFGELSNSSSVCSTHGICERLDNCKCDSGWAGQDCSIPICNGVAASDPSVCSSHGICTDVNTCKCDDSYYGEFCQSYNATANDFTIQVYSTNNENLYYVNPTEDLILKCLVSTEKSASYIWSTSYESSESTKSYLIVPSSVLQSRKSIQVTVQVTADSITKTLTKQVKVNEPPSIGNFIITPSFGYTLETFFKLECNDSYDPNLPLTYKFIYKLDTESEWKTLSEQSIEKSFSTSLPEGNQQIAVLVYDSFMSYTQSNTIIVKVSTKTDISTEALAKIETQTISIPIISSLSNIISTQNSTNAEVTTKAVQIVSNYFTTQLEKESTTTNITSSKLSASVSSVSSVSKSFGYLNSNGKSVIMDYFKITLQKAALSSVALSKSDYQTSLKSLSAIEKTINSRKRVQQTIYSKIISVYKLLSEMGSKSLLEDSSANKIEGKVYQSYSKYLKGSNSLIDMLSGDITLNMTSPQSQPCIVDVKTYVNELLSTEFKYSKVFEFNLQNPSTFKQIDITKSNPIAKFKFPFSTTTRSIISVQKDTRCQYQTSYGSFTSDYCEFSYSESGELVLSVSRTGLFVVSYQEAIITPTTSQVIKPQTSSSSSSNGNSAMIIGIAVGVPVAVLLIVAIVIVIVVACFLKRRKSKSKSNNLEMELTIMDTNNISIGDDEPVPEPFVIPPEQISTISKLGDSLYKSELTLRTTGEKKIVAVQNVNGKATSPNDLMYLKEVDHQNVVHIHGISTLNDQRVIVREYVEGLSLQDMINQMKSGQTVMDFDEKFDLLLQVARGVNYLHKLPNRVIHGDLKPSNCLIERNDMSCKVCDFGLSKLLSAKDTTSSQYLANELISGNSHNLSKSVDVYSFGIIMWEILFEENPYEYRNTDKFFFETDFQNSAYFGLNSNNFLPSVANGLRPVIPFNQENAQKWLEQFHRSRFTVSTQVLLSMKHLMESCWHADSSHRPSFETIIKEISQIRNKLEYNMSVFV